MAATDPLDRAGSSPLLIRTERLLLRPVAPSDAAATAALVSEDVASSLATWPSPMTAEKALEKIHASMRGFAECTALDMAILAGEETQLAGWIGFLNEGDSIRLAYWLGADYRGRGFIAEAARHAIPAAADFLRLSSFHARVLKTNERSVRILSRLGFSLVGEELVTIETRNTQEQCVRFELRFA